MIKVLQKVYERIVAKVPWYVWWIVPGSVILVCITMPPFIWMIRMSFYEIFLSPTRSDQFVGWLNYAKYFSDPDVLEGWRKLGIYIGSCMGLQMGIGFGIALLVNKSKYEGKLLTIFLIPMMVAPVATGFLWRLILHSSYGMYHWLLMSIGLVGKGGSLLSNPGTALWAIIIMDTWEWTPLIILIAVAGLKTIPKQVVEAARIDGATKFQIFRDVTLPFVSPALLIAFLLRFMDNIRFITKIISTTGGGPADATKTISTYLYLLCFRQFDLGYGATMGFLLLIFTIITALVLTNVFTKHISAKRERAA